MFLFIHFIISQHSGRNYLQMLIKHRSISSKSPLITEKIRLPQNVDINFKFHNHFLMRKIYKFVLNFLKYTLSDFHTLCKRNIHRVYF